MQKLDRLRGTTSTETHRSKTPSNKHIFDRRHWWWRWQQWWQWQQSTNGNNANKNSSSNSSSINDKDLYICSNVNSFKVQVLLDALEHSVSSCSGPTFPMRRSEGRMDWSMAVSIDETWGKGIESHVNNKGETTMIGHSTWLLLCMPNTVRHHDFPCLLRKHWDQKLLTVRYVNKLYALVKPPSHILIRVLLG